MAASRLTVWQRSYDALSRWFIRSSGYYKLGLRREDLIMEEYPGVREALRRLPQEELDKRNYRMARALDLSMKHRILPESEWTNTDEEEPYGLLEMTERVNTEEKERKMWNKM
ncbi:cytochrome b-c1 complex subunit 7-like [Corticium candelabrum]|uniref:cytochrome b-c1 complex subunit 7-like n=1 Tax=Corticium candelabrum TaxID=121492 RepID=UPI002E266171|nr:cytochrome b-c1 complex subunit 7-like [Corticium candelabrum]